MDQIQEKIDIFADHLYNLQKKAGEALIAEAELKQKNKITEAETILQKEKRAMEERSYQVIFRDTNRLIAQGQKKAKDDRLALNTRLQDDFLKTLLETAKSLHDTDIYKNYLSASVKSLPGLFGDRKDLILTVSENDKGLVAELMNDFPVDYHFTIEQTDYKENTAGGFAVCDAGHQFFCDFSLEHLIQENLKHIGKRLIEEMTPYMEERKHDK